jgi:hypothetical protein
LTAAPAPPAHLEISGQAALDVIAAVHAAFDVAVINAFGEPGHPGWIDLLVAGPARGERRFAIVIVG